MGAKMRKHDLAVISGHIRLCYPGLSVCVESGQKDGGLYLGRGNLCGIVDAVKGICFRRNYGKSPALNTGFARAQGDVVITMDADLQDPPALLPEMFSYIDEGYDSVATRRVSRKGEPPVRSFFARMFYRLMKRISKTEIMDGARDYRLMSRQMVDAILSMGEYNRFTKGIFGWVGFKIKWLEYKKRGARGGQNEMELSQAHQIRGGRHRGLFHRAP